MASGRGVNIGPGGSCSSATLRRNLTAWSAGARSTFCQRYGARRSRAGDSFLARGSPSRSPAEGSLLARGSPSRSPAEGSLLARGSPSRSPAEGSVRRGCPVLAGGAPRCDPGRPPDAAPPDGRSGHAGRGPGARSPRVQRRGQSQSSMDSSGCRAVGPRMANGWRRRCTRRVGRGGRVVPGVSPAYAAALHPAWQCRCRRATSRIPGQEIRPSTPALGCGWICRRESAKETANLASLKVEP